MSARTCGSSSRRGGRGKEEIDHAARPQMADAFSRRGRGKAVGKGGSHVQLVRGIGPEVLERKERTKKKGGKREEVSITWRSSHPDEQLPEVQ